MYSGFLRIVYIKDCERRSSGREVDTTSGKVLYTGSGWGGGLKWLSSQRMLSKAKPNLFLLKTTKGSLVADAPSSTQRSWGLLESPRDPPARVTHPTLTTSASAKGLLPSIPRAPPSNLCHPPHLTWTFLQVPGRVWPGEPLSFSDCCRVPTSCGVILSHTETNHVSPTAGNRHTCVLTLTKLKKKKIRIAPGKTSINTMSHWFAR